MPQDDHFSDETDHSIPWELKFDNMIPNKSWYWWWWLFFIDDPEKPAEPKQLMILWSTKYTDDITVDRKRWSVNELPHREDGVLKFDGMAAAWWYDGDTMHDPLLLKEMNFEVENGGKKGELRPICDGDYRFFGSPRKYRVHIVDAENDFRLELTPWNEYMQKHRFKENYYTKKYSYNIMKIYGMKLSGTIEGEDVTGTAYFQRVNVNAPATPWYWGLVHCETGSFIHYFNPFIGPQIFRTKGKQRSRLDWGDISLSKTLHFYHRESDTEYKFRKKDITLDHSFEGDNPVFYIRGDDGEKRLYMELEAYSRAYWRFQQPRRFGMKSILYYNEYPATLREFRFEEKDGSLTVDKGDLGKTSANFEHTWGKMF